MLVQWCSIVSLMFFFPAMQEDLYSLTKTLCAGAENDMGCKKVEKFLYMPLLVMEPRRLAELLQIWTSVAQGQQIYLFQVMHTLKNQMHL